MPENKDAPNPDFVDTKYRIVGIGELAVIYNLVGGAAESHPKIKVHIESASPELFPGRYSYVIEEI